MPGMPAKYMPITSNVMLRAMHGVHHGVIRAPWLGNTQCIHRGRRHKQIFTLRLIEEEKNVGNKEVSTGNAGRKGTIETPRRAARSLWPTYSTSAAASARATTEHTDACTLAAEEPGAEGAVGAEGELVVGGVGALEGAPVGDTEGAPDGERVGDALGMTVGAEVTPLQPTPPEAQAHELNDAVSTHRP